MICSSCARHFSLRWWYVWRTGQSRIRFGTLGGQTLEHANQSCVVTTLQPSRALSVCFSAPVRDSLARSGPGVHHLSIPNTRVYSVPYGSLLRFGAFTYASMTSLLSPQYCEYGTRQRCERMFPVLELPSTAPPSTQRVPWVRHVPRLGLAKDLPPLGQ